MIELVVFGAGKFGKKVCEMLSRFGIVNVAVLDNNSQKTGLEICGYMIESIEAIKKYSNRSLFIAVADKMDKTIVKRDLEAICPDILLREIDLHYLIFKIIRESGELHDYMKKLSIHAAHKILFDCPNGFCLGGAEVWLEDLCSSLIDTGVDGIYVLSGDMSHEAPYALKGRVLPAHIHGRKTTWANAVKSVLDVLSSEMPCTVIISQPNFTLVSACLLKEFFRKQIRIIGVIHSGIEQVYEEYIAFRDYIDVYVAVSEDIQQNMILRGIDKSKVLYAPKPFLCINKLQRKYSSDERLPLQIGYAGRLEGMNKEKRMDLILNLIHELVQRNVRYHFAFAGDGKDRNVMEKYLKDNHIERNVQFLGRLLHQDIQAFWALQDICINLSDFEGRSLSTLEAMGAGTIPVVTDTSGVREDITDGLNGYIVPIGNFMMAADRIEYLASHRELLSRMGTLAHKTVYPKSKMKPYIIFWEKILKDFIK